MAPLPPVDKGIGSDPEGCRWACGRLWGSRRLGRPYPRLGGPGSARRGDLRPRGHRLLFARRRLFARRQSGSVAMPASQQPPPHSHAVRRPPHILIIDDDPALLRTLERVLRTSRPGWRVTTAPTVREATEWLLEAQCDVLVTDLDMPGTGGIDLLKHARQRYPTVVRVVHSARVADVACDPSTAHLADVLLAKPVETAQLLEELDAALARSEESDELPGSVG